MLTYDLFEDLDALAREYGWTHLGQPHDYVRRYGKAVGDRQVTVTVHANLPGTALKRAARRTTGPAERPTHRVLGHTDGGKRDQVVRWLRFADRDERTDI